jgi:HlyD family secretion protein
MKKKLAIVAVALVLILGALGFVLRSSASAALKQSAAVKTVEKKDLQIQVEATGLIEPLRVVEVKSRASGEVLRAQAETGMEVAQGTLLAEIDPREVENALVQAQADVDAARVHAITTESNRKRMASLRADSVVTVQEYESALEQASTARAAQVRAETNLQLAKERRGDVTIKAPIAGTVIERTVEPGQIIASATGNVSGGTTMFKMADLSTMQVRVRVDETDIGQVMADLPVKVTVSAYPDKKFTGTVLKIEPLAVVEQNVTMFPVLVRLENPQGLLKPGMNAEVAIEIANHPDAVVIPNGAVVNGRDVQNMAKLLGVTVDAAGGRVAGATTGTRTGRAGRAGSADGTAGAKAQATRPDSATGGGRSATVFVTTATGTTARRVTLGLSDWESTEVLKGLEPGEQVVLVSVAQLQQKQQQANDRAKAQSGGMLGSGSTDKKGG